MSTKSLKPLIESAILTLEQFLENRQTLPEIDPYGRPEDEKFYAEHNQILRLEIGLCSNIRINQINNLDLEHCDPRISEFEKLFEGIASQWPNSSGSDAYPVPMPEHFNLDWEYCSEPDKELDEHTEQEKAYAAYHVSSDECVNMYADDYGELRFQLAEFALKKLKEKVHVNS